MRCGFYKVDITPPLGTRIPGSFAKRTAWEIKDIPYARAVVFDNGKEKVAILSADILYIYWESYKEIIRRVCEFTDIPANNIMITATHSHSGGPTFYDQDTDQDTQYVKMFALKAADAVILANARLTECDVYYGSGDVFGVSFVRDFYMKDGTLATNPKPSDPIDRPQTEIDPEFAVLSVKDEQGRMMGAVANFACHPATLADGNNSIICGEYPGVLERELRKLYGEDFVCVFLNGTCGNLSHWDITKQSFPRDQYVEMGKKLAQHAAVIIDNSKKLQDETVQSIKEEFNVGRRFPTEEEVKNAKEILSRPERGNMLQNNAKWILDYHELSKTLGNTIPVGVQVIRIGDAAIHAIPGEVFVQFGKKIKSNTPFKKAMVASHSNGSCLYIVPKELVGSGLYEAQVNSNIYEANTGDIISDKAVELAKKLY